MASRAIDALPSRIEQRLDAQVGLAARLKNVTAYATVPKAAPFLTISRQYGCDAMALAEALAPKLAAEEGMSAAHWPIYNRQILETLSSESHLSAKLIDELDVHARGGIEEFFQTLIGKSPPDIQVLRHLVRTERALALIGRCILIGRGGVLLTEGLPGGMHIRLAAPPAWRLKNLIARYGWDEHRARTVLKEEEDIRHSFFHKYLGQNVNDPLHYDLILNTARVDLAEQVESILGFFKARQHLLQVT